MSTRRIAWVVGLAIAVGLSSVGCQKTTTDFTGATTLRFRGVDFVAFGSTDYVVPEDILVPIGTADAMNFPHVDSNVYEVPGVDAKQVVVAYEGIPRSMSLFVRSDVAKGLAHGPSGVEYFMAVPGLCPFWTGQSAPGCSTAPT